MNRTNRFTLAAAELLAATGGMLILSVALVGSLPEPAAAESEALSAPALGFAPERSPVAVQASSARPVPVVRADRSAASFPLAFPSSLRAQLIDTGRTERPVDHRSMVRNAIRAAQPALDLCYQNSLRANQNLRGRIVVSVSLQPNGEVAEARVVESTVDDAPVMSCIRRRLQALRLPALGEAVEVTVPLTLRPPSAS